jgi:DNA-binding NtrC family response regulator
MGKTIQPKIYVVEDDAPLNELLCQFLEMQDYKDVKGFFSGEDMLAELSHNQDTIIIQDFDLPGINGLEVLSKAKPAYPKAEFIFLSGQSHIETAVNAIKGGAFDYIIKDKFAKENVQTKINNLLKIKSLHIQKNRIKKAFVFLAILTFVSWLSILALIFLK